MADGIIFDPLSLADVRNNPDRLSQAQRIALVRAEQRRTWSGGQRTTVEELIRRYPALQGDTEAIIDLAYNEYVLRSEHGETVDPDEYLRRFPNHAEALRRQLALHQALEQMTFQSLSDTQNNADPKATMAAGAPVFDSLPATQPPSQPAARQPNAPATIVAEAAEAFQTLMQAPEPAPPAAAPPGAEPLGDDVSSVTVPGYEILSELGRGGMGVVFKARQRRLDRIVALKMILSGEFASKTDRERFRDEAVKLARVQHPNIVQIYEVGEHDGRPYFAMEYLDGGSLAREIAAQPLSPKIAARLILSLANAMAAAHDKGIVHRDLKPGNILLSAGGLRAASEQGVSLQLNATSISGVDQIRGPMAKITDFGLAKGMTGEESRTVSGAVLGTPSYMAPEQAQGKSKSVGPAADIYALGAILFECLTGRPPFLAPNVIDTIYQVVHEEPVKPSALNPKLPRDLETICLKCLEKEPSKRYLSAKLLAEDLEAFLDNRPIRARPVGLMERAWKWAKRRPAAAALIGTIVVGLVGAIAAGVVVNERLRTQRNEAIKARQEEEQARKEAVAAKLKAEESEKAERQAKEQTQGLLVQVQKEKDTAESERRKAEIAKAQAEENERKAIAAQKKADDNFQLAENRFRLTKKAVDTYFTQVSINDRLDEPGMESLRKYLLRLAGDYYADFIKERTNDIGLQKEAARAVARLAQITAMESVAEAIAQYREALTRLTALAKVDPADAQLRDDIATTNYELAVQLRKAKMHAEAIETARTAVDQWRAILCAVDPANKEPFDRARAGLARSWDGLGGALYAVRDYDGAAQAYDEALRIRESLAAEDLDNETALRDKAVTLDNIANLAADRDDFPVAEAARNQVHEIFLDLVSKNPKRAKYRNDLARNELNLGNLYLRQNPTLAAKWFREAASRWESLASQTSEVPAYRFGAGQAYRGLAQALMRLNDDKGAADALDKAQKIFKELVRSFPDAAETPQYQAELARTEYNSGDRLFLTKAYAPAIDAYRRAAATLEALVAKNPEFQAELANVLLQLAIRLRTAGRGDEVKPVVARDRELWDALLAADPANKRYRTRAMSCLVEAARASLRDARRTGSLEEGLAQLERCLALGRHFGNDLREGSPERTITRDAFWYRAELLSALGRLDEALAEWDRAIALSPEGERDFFKLYKNTTVARKADFEPAVKFADEKSATPSAKAQYQLARIYALASASAARDEKQPAAERTARSEALARKAVERLQSAHKAGYFEDPEPRSELAGGLEWQPLAGRPDFQSLLSDLKLVRAP